VLSRLFFFMIGDHSGPQANEMIDYSVAFQAVMVSAG